MWTYAVDFLRKGLDKLGNDGEVRPGLADDDVRARIAQEAHVLHGGHDSSDCGGYISTPTLTMH